MQINEQQHKAAQRIFKLIATEPGKNRAVHPATAISAAPRLSGSYIFRSFNSQFKNVSPGNLVLSEEANENFPVLINFTGWMLSNLGVSIDEKQFDASSMSISDLSLLNTLKLLQSRAEEIMSRNKIEYKQMAYACAMTTAFLIKECRCRLPVQSGFNTASYSLIESGQTYSPELTNPTFKKKSIFTFWK